MKTQAIVWMRLAALLICGLAITAAACKKDDGPMTTKSSTGRLKKPMEGPMPPKPKAPAP